MKLFRNIISLIAGYAIFVISAVLLFQLSGIDPHADPSIALMIGVIAYGVAFSFIGGLAAQLISGSGKLTINYILGAIIGGFATFSLFKSTGNHYSQLAAIFLFAPASVLAGIIYLKRKLKQ